MLEKDKKILKIKTELSKSIKNAKLNKMYGLTPRKFEFKNNEVVSFVIDFKDDSIMSKHSEYNFFGTCLDLFEVDECESGHDGIYEVGEWNGEIFCTCLMRKKRI